MENTATGKGKERYMNGLLKSDNILARFFANTNSHVWISLILFCSALMFPAYYIKETHEPTSSLMHLITGWLGLLAGYYAWLANPAFLIAVIKYRKPKTSYIFSTIALCLALSFILHKKMIISEAPTFAMITAYGWGYFLWVLSMIVFTAGQYSLSKKTTNKTRFTIIIACATPAILVFSFHYFIGENSQFSIEINRDRVFKERCSASGESIFRKVSNAKGIYFSSTGGGNYEMLDDGSWHYTGGGISGMNSLQDGSILFYETNNYRFVEKNDDHHMIYRKYVLGKPIGVPTDHLESNYAVLIKKYNLPQNLGINAEKITVNDLADNSVLAEAEYVYDPIDKRFCGNAKRDRYGSYKSVMHYSPSTMVYEVLGLFRNRGRYLAEK